MTASALFRPSVTRLATVATGTALTYSAYHYSTTSQTLFTRTAWAEAPTSISSKPEVMPWKGFTELSLQSAEQVSPNVKKLVFSLPSENHITGLSTVSSLFTQHTPEGSWIPVFRPYTPISTSRETGTVTFLIKQYPGGKASTKFHSLQPGDKMKFRPLAEYAYTPNQVSDLFLIAGGSGITPLWQLTQTVLQNPADRTKVTLVYANNSEQDILLRKEIEDLERQHPDRFRKIFVISQNTASSSSPSSPTSTTSDGSTNSTSNHEIKTGYITKTLLQDAFQPTTTTPPSSPQQPEKQKLKVLVSSPPGMTESVAGAKGLKGWTQGNLGGLLKEMGFNQDDVYKF